VSRLILTHKFKNNSTQRRKDAKAQRKTTNFAPLNLCAFAFNAF
jgi:succinate-acetate transporter protein